MTSGNTSGSPTGRHPRVAVIGASEFTAACASGVLDAGASLVGIVGIPESLRPDNSLSLGGFARNHGIAYHEFEDLNAAPALSVLRSHGADYVLSSWPFLLREGVLSSPRRFVIGSHPTALPYNRGRHPAHWTIVLGLKTSALTFFRMDEGIDSGPVLQQTPFSVPDGITVDELNSLISGMARPAVAQLCRRLADQPDFGGIPQDGSLANYWRKRTPHDVTLDFRMSGDSIVRTVRSFAPPYPGAILLFDAHVIRVVDAKVALVNMEPERFLNAETGRVIEASGRRMIVKAADCAVELVTIADVPADVAAGRCIHPPARYIEKHGDLSLRLNLA